MDMEKMVVNHATWGRSRHLEATFAQDKTQRELEKHSGNHPDKVSLLKSQCNLQEGRHYS